MRGRHKKKPTDLDLPSCPFWGDANYVEGAIICKDDMSGNQMLLRLPNKSMATKTNYKNKHCMHMRFEACPNYKALAKPYEEE